MAIIELKKSKWMKADEEGLNNKIFTISSPVKNGEGLYGPKQELDLVDSDGMTRTLNLKEYHKRSLISMFGNDDIEWLNKKVTLFVVPDMKSPLKKRIIVEKA